MTSKSKNKKIISRPANQPSLFSFWGKTKNEVTNKEVSKKRNEMLKQRYEAGASFHKKQRVEEGRELMDQATQLTRSKVEEQLLPVTKTLEDSPMSTQNPNAESEGNEERYWKGESDQMAQKASSIENSVTSTAVIPDDEDLNNEEASTEGDLDSDDEMDDTTTSENANSQGLSDYELLRLRNIARNNARLEALGLLTSVSTGKSSTSIKKYKRPVKRPAKSTTAAPTLPARRSSRLSKTRVDEPSSLNITDSQPSSEDQQSTQDISKTMEPEDVYEVSPIVQYQMNQMKLEQESEPPATQSHKRVNGSAGEQRATMLVPCDYRLAPSQGLSAIYSLNFYKDTSWIVGAGKSGIVALWNCQREDEVEDPSFVDPVFTWKAHSGRWISEAQFLPSNDQIPKRLVTAANDGTVCLWDLAQVSKTSGIPKLQQQSNKSWHTSGIFAMDINSGSGANKIVTGSKDKTVAIATVDSGSFTPIWRSHNHHGKVGAVRFRDDHVLATASDDGCVAVLDDRMPGEHSAAITTLENLHNGRPHSVVWGPTSHALLTAGLDSVIQQWDLRYLKTNAPLFEYVGHIPTTTRRYKRIHHPIIYSVAGDGNGGPFILTGGEGSYSLSMFQYNSGSNVDVENGDSAVRSAVYSRGRLPDDCNHSDVGSIAVQHDLVATTVDGEVLLLKPGLT